MGDRTHFRKKRKCFQSRKARKPRVVGYRGRDGFELWYYIGEERLVIQCRSAWSGRVFLTDVTGWKDWQTLTSEERKERAMGWIKKAETMNKGEEAKIAGYDDELCGAFPALHEYMTCKVGPDGKPRKPSSLTLFFEDGVVKGVLNERDEGLSLWASADGLWTLLGALDTLLKADPTPWRKAGQAGGKKRA